MNLEDLGNIGEFVGGIGVMITLLYLALQIRHNTNSIRGAAELESERMRMEWHRFPADNNNDMSEIFDNAHIAPDDLTPQERQRFIWFVSSYFHILEGSWLQHRRGLLDESGWTPLQAAMLGLLMNPVVAEWWDEEGTPYSQVFREFANNLRNEDVKPGWKYRPQNRTREG